MSTDARFDKIQKIIPIEKADSLETAIVSNFPCVVRKGEFKEGEYAFYIRDDSKLLEFDAYAEWSKSMAEGGIGPNEFQTNFEWQIPLMRYLGSGGRVKTVKLRDAISMGILLKTDVVCPNIKVFDDSIANYFNSEIANPETGDAYLERNFGIGHWTAPSTGFGSFLVKYQGLPEGLKKSDETNWENLDDVDLHLGSKCLVTKKLDGSSTTVTCYPDGHYEISSRSQTFNVEEMENLGEENVYTKYTKEAVKAGLWYAKTYGHIIALRGETCCASVQNSSYNKDCRLNDFFVYGCKFPELENWYEKNGVYGTCMHFMKVVKRMNDNGFNVKTVPVLGEEIITKDLLKKYNDVEWNWGEGAVLNVKVENINDHPESFVWDYKSKSREYLMKMK